MDTRILRSFLLESLAWLMVILVVMFLVQPSWTINALERPIERPAPIIIALGSGLAVAHLRRQFLGPRKTLRASTLVLEDSTGKGRIWLSAEGATPNLAFWTAAGLPQVILSGDEKEPSLSIFGGTQLNSAAVLSVSDDGSGLRLGASPGGEMGISLDANHKKPRLTVNCPGGYSAELQATENEASLSLTDADAQYLTNLSLDKDGAGLVFHDTLKAGPQLTIGAQDDSSSLMVSSRGSSCLLHVDEDGPILTLQDAEGNLVRFSSQKQEDT
ncbi:MAG: hypothetical protein LAO76_09505 [Acidobacteriia bacterium]|nr:hypothetical protein [Terriglobia bacterium]